jgi:Ferritin-like
MRFQMARHLGWLTREHPAGPPRSVSAALAPGAAAPIQPDLPPPEFSERDYLSFLLYIDAEIEQGLMVQYLYAAYSLGGPQVPEQYQAMIRGWQEVILGIAKEEMGHLLSVQNVLRLIGAPLNFSREDFPWDTPFYPFPFSLEPLTLESLASYVYAESPVGWSGPEADLVNRLMKRITSHPHQISAFFKEILRVISDPAIIPDEVFQVDTLPYQANWDTWGRGYQGGQRGNATGANPKASPNVLVMPVASRDDAVASLTQIAEQGEACPTDDPANPSHFARFLKIFNEMKELAPICKKKHWSPARNVAHNPYIPSDDGSPPTSGNIGGVKREPITNPEAAYWGYLFNVRYRMLLNYLTHSYDLAGGSNDTGPRAPLGSIINASFGEMYNLRAIASIMVETPLSPDPAGKTAGPPFQMPYTLNRPAGEANRWRMHRQLLLACEPLIANLLAQSPASRHRYLNSLRDADGQLLGIIDRILEGYAMKVL